MVGDEPEVKYVLAIVGEELSRSLLVLSGKHVSQVKIQSDLSILTQISNESLCYTKQYLH